MRRIAIKREHVWVGSNLLRVVLVFIPPTDTEHLVWDLPLVISALIFNSASDNVLLY